MKDSYSKIVLTNPVSDIINTALPQTKYTDHTGRSSTLTLASNPNTTFGLINFLKNAVVISMSILKGTKLYKIKNLFQKE